MAVGSVCQQLVLHVKLTGFHSSRECFMSVGNHPLHTWSICWVQASLNGTADEPLETLLVCRSRKIPPGAGFGVLIVQNSMTLNDL